MKWPKKGDKLKFKGVPEFTYPMFTDIRENAEKNLEIGKEYTVLKCEVYSSWCAVWLEGFPDDEKNEVSNCFQLPMFEWDY